MIFITNEMKSVLHSIIKQECSCSILVISSGNSFREGFFTWEKRRGAYSAPPRSTCEVERIKPGVLYPDTAQPESILTTLGIFPQKPCYDLIILDDQLSDMPLQEALCLLKALLPMARRQVLALLPELGPGTANGLNNGLQMFPPTVFAGFDFTYVLLGARHESRVQLYSFYPSPRAVTAAIPFANSSPRFLSLAYILPDQDLTGGMKQLLLQMKEMHKRGHRVVALTRGRTKSAIPQWSELTEGDIDGQHVLATEEAFSTYVQDADAVIVGWMQQTPELLGAGPPVFLWEQGSSQLFGDFGKPRPSQSKELAAFRSYYRPPVKLMAVSPLVKTILQARFGRASHIVSAAIEPNNGPKEKQTGTGPKILLVGDGQRHFKNFTFAIETLFQAYRKGVEFQIQWATPTQPAKDMVPKGLLIEYHVAPSQEKLHALYRGADILLSHSLYEAFSLPPLEAMAAGTAVLALNNGGIEAYAEHGRNCLLYQQADTVGYQEGLLSLLRDKSLRDKLAAEGMATAARFTPENMCNQLEQCLMAQI